MGANDSLDSLRREIDVIDDAIHDLIMQRTAVVERVRDAKRTSPVKIRPSREADILSRLVGRHRGPFPKRELVALWRQLICATLPFEGPFSVAVFMPETQSGYWDLARDHYGDFTPMSRHGSVRTVIEAVHRGEATVGVLPLPRNDDTDPWWRHLVTDRADAPRIIARLPFAGPGNALGGDLEALVISPAPLEPTGRDRSFVAVDSEKRLGLNQYRTALAEVGLEPVFASLWREEQGPRAWMYLAEVDGFLDAGDDRLERFHEALGKPVNRLVRLGGYARPFDDDMLGGPPRRRGVGR